jgi:glucose-1-phosphate thymidylyltransferase
VVAKGIDRERPALGPIAATPIGNRTLLEHALDAAAGAGVERIALAVEPSALERLERVLAAAGSDGRPAVEPFEHDPREGLDGLLSRATPIIGSEEFLFHLGDSVCWSLDLRAESTALGAADALIVVGPPPDGNGRALRAHRESVPETGGRLRARHLGVYAVGPDFGAAAAAVPVAERGDLAAATQATLALLAEHGGRTHYRRQDEAWRYSRDARSLLEANRLALERLPCDPVRARVEGSEIHGPLDVHPSVTIESSRIMGPVSIGAGCRIRQAYIGPYTTLGVEVEVEGAEVSDSVIMDGAAVRHIGERLEASVIGANAQVSRQFRLPRAMRLEVGAGAEVLLA